MKSNLNNTSIFINNEKIQYIFSLTSPICTGWTFVISSIYQLLVLIPQIKVFPTRQAKEFRFFIRTGSLSQHNRYCFDANTLFKTWQSYSFFTHASKIFFPTGRRLTWIQCFFSKSKAYTAISTKAYRWIFHITFAWKQRAEKRMKGGVESTKRINPHFRVQSK